MQAFAIAAGGIATATAGFERQRPPHGRRAAG